MRKRYSPNWNVVGFEPHVSSFIVAPAQKSFVTNAIELFFELVHTGEFVGAIAKNNNESGRRACVEHRS